MTTFAKTYITFLALWWIWTIGLFYNYAFNHYDSGGYSIGALVTMFLAIVISVPAKHMLEDM